MATTVYMYINTPTTSATNIFMPTGADNKSITGDYSRKKNKNNNIKIKQKFNYVGVYA